MRDANLVLDNDIYDNPKLTGMKTSYPIPNHEYGVNYHLTGVDTNSGERYYLCLEGWAAGQTIHDLQEEFAVHARDSHIPNIVCALCYKTNLDKGDAPW